jgi:hypothetical protein
MAVKELVEREMAVISDPALLDLIRRLSVEPSRVVRDWDYGASGERHVCWTVLEHPPSNTGVAYCDAGFGPDSPWGLVSLSGRHMNIGMDSGWFATLEAAVRDSPAWDGPNPLGYEVT